MNQVNKNILIVDSDRFLCDFLASQVSSAGYSTVQAYGGNEAFNIVKTFPVAVLVCSWEMERGSGWELVRQTRARHPKYPYVIFMVEGDSLTDYLQEFAPFAVLRKPVEPQELVLCIDEALTAQDEEKRAFAMRPTRMESTLEAEVVIPGYDKIRSATVEDISEGGLSLNLKTAQPEIGTVVTFRVISPSITNGYIEGFGVIRWLGKHKNGIDVLAGTQFVNLGTEFREGLQQLLTQHRSTTTKKAQ